MRRNPLYSFRDRSAIGIYSVPINSTIHVLDEGDGTPAFVEMVSKNGLSQLSTIGDFLDDPTLYVDLGAEVIPSELEKVVEGSGTSTGWRILGRDVDLYGDIGQDAIDLSRSTFEGPYGATGDDSFAVGVDVQADRSASAAIGSGLVTNYNNELVVGKYNATADSYAEWHAFTVGIGTSSSTKADGLVVYTNGIVRAPGATMASIETAPVDALVTKEYSNDVDGTWKTIKVQRGTDAQRLLSTPLIGELFWTTDTKELWVGDGSTAGGIAVGGTGSSAFVDLTDTPASFVGHNQDMVVVDEINGTLTFTDTIDGGQYLG